MDCPVCASPLAPRFTHRVLGRHDVAYHWCRACGLLTTEEPWWLEEAYGTAIAELDTGILQRNLRLSAVTAGLLWFCFDPRGAFVDVAGGYGILVRLMRDLGFDFRWSDAYAENLVARGFEALPGTACEAVTAYEVLEHVRDPVAFLRESLERWGARSILFTTDLYEGEPPAPEDWWYYAFETGQHVSFYARRTLEAIAGRLGLALHSHANVHLLTDRRISPLRYRLLTGNLSRAVGRYVKGRMRTRTSSDRRALQSRRPQGPPETR